MDLHIENWFDFCWRASLSLTCFGIKKLAALSRYDDPLLLVMAVNAEVIVVRSQDAFKRRHNRPLRFDTRVTTTSTLRLYRRITIVSFVVEIHH
jgi:hypothetical protein